MFENKSLAYSGETLLYDDYELYYIDYNPLNLPPNTVRVKTSDGKVPYKYSATTYETATLVPGTSDVYDVYKSGTSFGSLLRGSVNVVEVLGANTTGITNMSYMFDSCTSLRTVSLFDTYNVTNMSEMFCYCTSLSTVPLFDTSNVTDMYWMFDGCSNLTTVPLFDTSNVTSMSNMFYNCESLTSIPLFNTSKVTTMYRMFQGCTSLTNIPLFDTSNVTSMQYTFWNCSSVQSGALALYQQASSQTKPPSNHSGTFYNCGSNTTTGAAELAQIPNDWKSNK